jgi:proteasome accessory factor A
MKRRIYGLEHEYGIICTPDQPGTKSPSIQNVVTYLFREIISGRMYPDVFLENGARFYQDIGCHPEYATPEWENGARFYQDIGCHPEYATPECDSVIDLVTHDKAGERIVR